MSRPHSLGRVTPEHSGHCFLPENRKDPAAPLDQVWHLVNTQWVRNQPSNARDFLHSPLTPSPDSSTYSLLPEACSLPSSEPQFPDLYNEELA